VDIRRKDHGYSEVVEKKGDSVLLPCLEAISFPFSQPDVTRTSVRSNGDAMHALLGVNISNALLLWKFKL
jgi:hypothetical protein